jgi:hypothetical protein
LGVECCHFWWLGWVLWVLVAGQIEKVL